MTKLEMAQFIVKVLLQMSALPSREHPHVRKVAAQRKDAVRHQFILALKAAR